MSDKTGEMRTWVLLLRGINVGGKNVLRMKELVRDLTALDLVQVKTYIQSGNAVFQASGTSSTALGERIGSRIEARHGFKPRVLVLSADDLRSAIDRNPFPEAEAEPKTLHLFFLESEPATPDMATLTSVRSSTEQFQLDGGVFYLHTPDGLGRSKLASNAERLLGVSATARNWRTVVKLADLAEISP